MSSAMAHSLLYVAKKDWNNLYKELMKTALFSVFKIRFLSVS